MALRIAVIGATGLVGREVLQLLHERRMPVDEVAALASGRSAGGKVSFGDEDLKVGDLASFDFAGFDLAICAAGAKAAREHAPRAAKAGCLVIDDSPAFRLDPDVPLVVPEVNAAALARIGKRRLVAVPSPAAVMLATALKPLDDLARARRVVVTTFEPVSGQSKAAMDELFDQTRAVYVNQPVERAELPKQIAFNAIPQVEAFNSDGFTRAEAGLATETRKLLGSDLGLVATCVRVPVFLGIAAAVTVAFERAIDAEAARRAWRGWHDGEAIGVVDHRVEEGYITPVEVVGEDKVYASRARVDPTVDHGLAFWCAADNVRRGAALTAVRIAELLIEKMPNRAA